MNSSLLPLHNKSKSIYFINSPKLWTKNFLSYLEEKHSELYITTSNALEIFKYFVIISLIISILYLVGYCCLSKIDDLYEDINLDIVAHLVVATMGMGILGSLFILCMILNLFITFTIKIILNIYNTLFDLIVVLYVYNTDISEETNFDV